MKQFVCNKFDSNQSVEKYIKKILRNAPLSFIYKIFRKKDVKVNGKRDNGKYILQENDVIELYITDAQFDEFVKEREIVPSDKIKEFILFENDDVLIINKPRNMLVQSDGGHDESLDEMVKAYCLFKGDKSNFLASPVHRIDRNTSGIVIFAKSLTIANYLSKVFKEHKLIKKTYYTLVKGKVENKGEINAPLQKNEKLNKVFINEELGKQAITQYELVFSNDKYSYLKVNLLTGRSHQIRAHLSYINHPVIGDEKYGDFAINREFKNQYNFENQFLHAGEISFGKLDDICASLSNKKFVAEMPLEEKEILDKIKEEK